MSRRVSPFKIGLLILIGGGLGIVALIWLGASHFFEKGEPYVTFFTESVKGLREDAQVNYRGVSVGRVSKIELAPDGRLIRIVMQLDPDFKVDRELAVRLRQQGLTGLRYLEIDKAPPDLQRMTPKYGFKTKHPVIPSYPSEFSQVYEALETLYAKVLAIDLKGLVEEWKVTASRVNDALEGDQMKQTLVQLNRASSDLAEFAASFRSSVDTSEIKKTVTSLREVSSSAAEFFKEVNGGGGGRKISEALDELALAAGAAKRTASLLAGQMSDVPPGTLGKTAVHLEGSLETLDRSLSTMNTRLDETFVLLQQNLYELRQLTSEITRLVRNLREDPSRVLYRPDKTEPFQRK